MLDVADGSIAQGLGFQKGDLIVSVNNRPIATTRDLERIAAEQSRLWRITINRGGQEISVVFGG